MSVYRYSQPDLMETPERYFYTALEGPAFLAAYLAARQATLANLPENALSEPAPVPPGRIATHEALVSPTDATLTRFARRFEVSRKVHAHYDAALKTGDGGTDDITLYARLARRLGERYTRTGDLTDLNALLKLCDLLASQPPARLAFCADDTRAALTAEIAAVTALVRDGGIVDVL